MTTSPLANPTATRELLEEFGLATKHRLGQNFLIDNHVIERICELSELAGDERVLEVGPGVGTLTLALLQEAACVTSIEADPELEPVLDAHIDILNCIKILVSLASFKYICKYLIASL